MRNNRSTYKVIIIGAGMIAGGYDLPGDEAIITHAHAYREHPGFTLKGFIDINPEQAMRAALTWGGQGYTSLDDAFKSQDIDIACLAVPDLEHYKLLKELVKYDLKVVLAEKPLCKTVAEAREIGWLYAQCKTAVAVNYSRRFLPELAGLRQEIKSGAWGAFRGGTGWYGKGLAHNGSHILDLLLYLLEGVERVQCLTEISDFYPDDPTVSAELYTTGGGLFMLQAFSCQYYSILEMDLLFEKGRVRICDGGGTLEYYHVREHPDYKGYKVLEHEYNSETSMRQLQWHVADNLYQHLQHGEKLKCSILDGIQVMELCSLIQESRSK